MFRMTHRVGRLLALIAAAGALTLAPARPAVAAVQQYSFQQLLPLEEACLRTIDVFGAYWWFDGKLRLDSDVFVDDSGKAWASVAGYTDSRGLNYKLGYYGRMKIWFHEHVPCYRDPVDGTLRAKIPFLFKIVGPGGGQLPSEMRVTFTATGAKVTGVTLGVEEESWDGY